MPWKLLRWMDGLVTGLVLAIVIVALCLAVGQPLGSCGAALFMVGGALAFLSVPLALGTRRPPGGVLALYGRARHRSAPMSLEAAPAPDASERPPTWWDRALTPDNVWLVAGGVLIVTSFLPPFLGT